MHASFATDRVHTAAPTKRAAVQLLRSPVCFFSTAPAQAAGPAVQAPEIPLDPNVSFARAFGAFGTGQLNGYIGTGAHKSVSAPAEEKVDGPKNVWIRSFCMDEGDGPHSQVNIKVSGGTVQGIREQDGNIQAQWTFSKSEHLQWDGLHHPFDPNSRVIGLAEGVSIFGMPQVRGWVEKADPAAVASSQPTTGTSLPAWYAETFFEGRAKGDSCMKGKYKGLTRTSTGAVYSAMPEGACYLISNWWEPYQTNIDVDAKLDLQALFAAAEQLPGPALPTDPSSWLQPILSGAPVTVRLSQVRKDYEGKQLWESLGTSRLIPGSSGVTRQGESPVWPWKLSEMEVPEGYQVITNPDGLYLIVPKLMKSGIPSSDTTEAAKHHGWGIETGVAGYNGRYVRVRTCFLPDGRVSKWHVAEYGVAHGESWDKQQ